jgi:hypothetical protein
MKVLNRSFGKALLDNMVRMIVVTISLENLKVSFKQGHIYLQ